MGEMTRDDAVREVVRRLVDYYQPERIYLIGSTARGEHRPDSDLDFVVVLPDDAPREKLIGGGPSEAPWHSLGGRCSAVSSQHI